MKKLCLILVLLPGLSVLASGPQATSKTPSGCGEERPRPVDIDITLGKSGNPTAPDVTLHRDCDDRARWNNRITNKDCAVIFSPFGLPNYQISHGRSTTSGPIVGPNGSYQYVIMCGDAERLPRKPKKTRPTDPTIIITGST